MKFIFIIFILKLILFKGHEREKTSVMMSFKKLVAHLRSLILFKFSIGFIDNIVAKYAATIVGWYTMSQSFFDVKNVDMIKKTKNELMEVIVNKN